jgi:Ca2+-transporting ATPase
MLLGSVFIVLGITLYQEQRTERVLEALRDLSSPRALVIRDGTLKRIAGREVVKDDLFVISEGDRVPADAVVLNGANVSVDESLLTGESVPVRKNMWDGKRKAQRPGGDDMPFVYSGSLVVSGKALCKTLCIGERTEIGKIGKSLNSLVREDSTKVQKEIMRLARYFFVIGASLCLIIAFVYGMTKGGWLGGILVGITIAMSLMPEEFPVVLTIFFAIGAWRIARKNVLTRRIPALEMVGAATVLCTDKTGTLTCNRMSVQSLQADGVSLSTEDHPAQLPERFHRLLEYSILASQKDPFDPMEIALRDAGNTYLTGTEHLHADWKLVKEYALSPELLAMSEVWESPDKTEYVIAAKGAPEAIVDLCHLPSSQVEELMRNVLSMAESGLRVIAVAAARFGNRSLPSGQHDFDFQFLGLLGLADPVRQDAPQAIAECMTAGIRVIMITGDHPRTAAAIAERIGLPANADIMTGQELDEMSDDALQERIKQVSVFARVVPEQKLRIVQALKANGEIVAMTGDGVNDAPALKAAHIGIAMGARGTDVAREAADLVLLDDNFASIVSAVRGGRRIFDNLKKATSYIVAIHVPIAGLSLIPVLFKWPLMFSPVSVLFIEMIIDPACTIIFEMEQQEKGIMHRPPRKSTDTMFNGRRLLLSVLQGCSVLALCLLMFVVGLSQGYPEEKVRALTFVTLIIANVGLILSNRSWSTTVLQSFRSKNPAVWWVGGGALLLLVAILASPFLRNIFHFAPLTAVEAFFAAMMGAFSILWFEALKLVRGLHHRRSLLE